MAYLEDTEEEEEGLGPIEEAESNEELEALRLEVAKLQEENRAMKAHPSLHIPHHPNPDPHTL